MTGPPIESAPVGPTRRKGIGIQTATTVYTNSQAARRPSPRVSEGRWRYTCGGYLLKHEPGPHCDQCIRWDRVIRGPQAAPPSHPIRPVAYPRDRAYCIRCRSIQLALAFGELL